MIFPPAYVLFITALLLLHPTARVRQALMLLGPLLTLYLVWTLPTEHTGAEISLAGFRLLPLKLFAYSKLFAGAFCTVLFAGCVYGIRIHTRTEIVAAFTLAGCAVGIAFAGDLLTLFFYWEIMAIASTLLMLAGNTLQAKRAAMRYALMHLSGGMVLLAGIAGYIALTGDALIASITPSPDFLSIGTHGWHAEPVSIALGFILAGILIGAAAWPFSAWLADSYPEASPLGAVFLSAFPTKAAIFLLLTLFSGTALLIPIGFIMILYGIVYALLENDIRRILSYSLINQTGFMVLGVGMGSPLAQQGVALYACCHIIYNALLFMSAGSVITMTGRRHCTELGGLYHTMRFTTFCGLIGALAISAFPFLNTVPLANEQSNGVSLLLLAANAGVMLHAGITYPWFVFFQKDSGLRPGDASRSMKTGMLLLALLSLIFLFHPSTVYDLLPGNQEYLPFSFGNLITLVQVLAFSALAFFLLLRFTPVLNRSETILLDTDWLYRVLLRRILLLTERLCTMLYTKTTRITRHLVSRLHG